MKKAQIISFANQKGGVGKTTSCANLAAALAKAGKKVLAIDFDPQANLSSFLGISPVDGCPTIAGYLEAAAQGESPTLAVQHTREGFDLIPSHVDLSRADLYLVQTMSRESVLRRLLAANDLDGYDYILIDCNPSLGLLLTNALVASDGVIVPVQVHPFGMDGLGTLFQAIETVRAYINPGLQLCGVLLTMKDNTAISAAVDAAICQAYDNVFAHRVPRRVAAVNAVAECRTSVAANDLVGAAYQGVAQELLERMEG